MCPIPPIAIYKDIADNPNLPDNLRAAALSQLEQAQIQDSVNKLATTAIEPSKGNTDFTCTIYSLQNKDFWGRTSDLDKSNPKINNRSEVLDFPGIKVQDSKGFHLKNADGSDVRDAAQKMAFDGLRATYKFYKEAFNRNSIDNEGMEICACIHLMRGYDNASWIRRQNFMVFGDGGRWDGRGWLPPTEDEMKRHPDGEWTSLSRWFDRYDLDTIGHELTHGVVQFTAALGHTQWTKYRAALKAKDLKLQEQHAATYSEAGTLNEHIADCFGIMLRQFNDGQTAETGSWDFSPNVWSDTAMKANGWTVNYTRTFKNLTPEQKAKSPDKDPKHWKKRGKAFSIQGFDKDGNQIFSPLDSHVNCGIANHAFMLAALKFKGNTWKGIGKIWYDALLDPDFKLPENQTFEGWKKLTTKHAATLFPANPDGKTIVEQAWNAVGGELFINSEIIK